MKAHYYYTNILKGGRTIQGEVLTTNRGERSKQVSTVRMLVMIQNIFWKETFDWEKSTFILAKWWVQK